MHNQPRRFVHHYDVFVLEQDGEMGNRLRFGEKRSDFRGENIHTIPGAENR
jgi:hypothetical protein